MALTPSVNLKPVSLFKHGPTLQPRADLANNLRSKRTRRDLIREQDRVERYHGAREVDFCLLWVRGE